MRLSAIAADSGLTVVRDGHFSTLGFLSLPRPGMLTFAESRAAVNQAMARAEAAALITTGPLAAALPAHGGRALAVATAGDPRRAFFELHNRLAGRTDFYGRLEASALHPTAVIDPTALVPADGVCIGAGSVIGPRVVIQGRCRIGEGVVVHPGAVIGAEGFQSSGFADLVLDMVHAGRVDVGDRVVIHANAVVARAVFDEATAIGEGSRIGNLAFVSHNVQVGRRCFIGHGAVVNGNVMLGDGTWVGPGSTIADRVRIGAGARISLGSAVIADLPDAAHVTGNVAIEHRRFLRHIAAAGRRPSTHP